jgi:glyoxylate/hydroxypyruvate reductase A
MNNVKALFSLGAGVDHILSLKNYRGQLVVRLKDPLMAERMANHILSQILFYQLNLKFYQRAQQKNKWITKFHQSELNHSLTIGILGVGYLGSFVGKQLQKNGYNVIGFKNSKPKKKYPFSIFYKKNNLKKFLHQSDVVACILPSTSDTYHMINKNFLLAMKKKVLLINVGRGSTLCEKELIAHLRKNKNFFVSLDVFETEPLTKVSPLWKIPNVTITPHIASITLIDSAVEYIYKKYRQYKKNGKIKSDVNFKKGY